MIRHYLTLAFRNLIKYATHSAVNILGLAVSLCAGWLIVQYTSFELRYDQFHHRAEDTYRIYQDIYKAGALKAQSARVAPAVASTLQQTLPEIEAYTRLINLGPDGVLTYQDRSVGQSDMMLADDAFFTLFSFQLLRGNQETALRDPFSVVITEETARTLFGTEDPMGKSVVIHARNFDGAAVPFQVTGVIENVPPNTHLTFGALIAYPTLFTFVGHRFDESWSWNETYTYVRLRPHTSPRVLQAQFPDVVHRFNETLAEDQLDWQYKLQPITDIHLYSDLQHEITANSKARYVYGLLVAGALLLLMAYINFINLVTVKAMQRAKEVGVRKVSGAFRNQLMMQFLTESFVINSLAVIMACILADVARPFIVDHFHIHLSGIGSLHPMLGVVFLGGLVLLILGTAGYPALILSGYTPINALKEHYTKGVRGRAVRRLLVTGQFTLAMMLMMLTFSAMMQVRFMQRQSLGFEPEQVVVIHAPQAHDYGYGTNFSGFRQKVSGLASVTSVSAANAVPGQEVYWYDDRVTINGAETSGVFSVLGVAPNYFAHYAIPLVQGQLFTDNTPPHSTWVINESAMRLLRRDTSQSILGQRINGREIIGVVKDFHQESLKTAVPPSSFLWKRLLTITR